MYPFPDMSTDERPGPWTPLDIIALVCQPGYMSPKDWRPATVGATFYYESAGGDPLAIGKLIWKPGHPLHLSQDEGLFQLNSYYTKVTGHYPSLPPITTAQVFDPLQAWPYVWEIMNKDRPDAWHYNLRPWHGFTSGRYDQWLDLFNSALVQYREQYA